VRVGKLLEDLDSLAGNIATGEQVWSSESGKAFILHKGKHNLQTGLLPQ